MNIIFYLHKQADYTVV